MSRKTLGVVFGAVSALIAAPAAFSQDVSYDYDKSYDFAGAKTYVWVDGTRLKDEFNHQRIVNAVNSQLAAKGLTKAAVASDADVVVTYHASFDKDLQISGFSSGFGGYRWGGTRSGTATVDEIVIGTIVVDIADAEEKKMVWRGIASKEVDVKASPEKREKNIQKAAEKLFKNFPPKPKS